MRRRTVLTSLGAVFAALAGCGSNCVRTVRLYFDHADPVSVVERVPWQPDGRAGFAKQVVRDGPLRCTPESGEDPPVSNGTRVRVNGTYYSIRRSVNQSTVTYNATAIAETKRAFGRELIDTYAFTLELDSEDQRSVVQEAIDGDRYQECSPEDDSALAAVIDELQRHEQYSGSDAAGNWLVRFEGSLYDARLRQIAA